MRLHSLPLSAHRAGRLVTPGVWFACLMCLASPAAPGQQQAGVKDAPRQTPPAAAERLDVGDCLPLPAEKRYLFVDDRERLVALLDGGRPEGCADFKVPEVDFGKYTLLGLGIGTDCGGALEPLVVIDEAVKEYRVTGGYPACAGFRPESRWYKLPKMPRGHKVSIVINGYDFVTGKRER